MPPAELPPVGPPPQQRGRPAPHDEAASAKHASTSGSGANRAPKGTTTRELWLHCEAALTSFDPNTHTVDSHMAEYLAAHPKLGESERGFVQQVCYGCTRYKVMLRSAVGKYLSVKRRMNDCFTAFVILTYLAMFRLQELGLNAFKALVRGCSSHSRVAEYLKFLFEPGSAQQHFTDEWKATFDDNYVETVLFGHIEHSGRDMLDLAADFDVLASGQEQRQREQAEGKVNVTAKPITKPEPFQLSQARPRVAPEPEQEPPAERPPRPVDSSTKATHEAIAAYRSGRMISTLDESRKDENRRLQAGKAFNAPRLRSLERPRRLPEVRRRMEVEQAEAERPLPRRPGVDEVRRRLARLPTEAPKVTAAAVLREDSVWRRRDEEAMAALRKKETELRDDTEFKAWQSRMLGEDEARAKALVAQRKVEMMLADEEARVARRKQERKNAREAAELKEHVDEQLTKMRSEQAARQTENREFVTAQKEMLKECVKKANVALDVARKDGAKVIREEDRMLELKLAENMELELLRKAEIIRTIREEVEALKYEVDIKTGKRVRKAFKREFDPESTANLGTLGEMSMAELQRKLAETRCAAKEWRENRAESIVAEAAAKKREHSERVENVRRRREQQQMEKQAQREKKRSERRAEEARQRDREEEQLVALQGKLREKRDERRREEEMRRERERARLLQQQYKAADKGAREAKNWAEKELGMERIAQRAQHGKITADRTASELKAGLHSERERNIENALTRQRKCRAEQSARVREEHRLLASEQIADRIVLEKAATAERQRKLHAKKLTQGREQMVLDALDSMTMPHTL
eukprot:TRINITY_DN43518_c0_g1_i1.p1 TRINITY_DN43518_c0_g1~~TRINITY_DN43518_c0_g1_i1.p1  ORF type:complete len:818 (+),score=325.97 TRINITY_DN43518_c0_g1_i1:50-2503(+)